jgi:pantoate--beta-alanine ligase
LIIFYKTEEIETFILDLKSKHKTIGFVPTMGALHEGHVSLVKESKLVCDFTIVSVFVNPTQFNNIADFEKYPINSESDIKILQEIACDVLFLPTKEEIYTANYVFPKIDLGLLDQVLEGKHRPGHFKGVIQVVYRFFEIIRPTKAFFGLKDFQQLAVIKKMTDFFDFNIAIIPCKTIRENDGLAMSSRNMRLSQTQRIEALFIFESLILAKNLAPKLSPIECKKIIEDRYLESSLKLEYFEIINPESFEILITNWCENAVACAVAYVGDVRLIDNMVLN